MEETPNKSTLRPYVMILIQLVLMVLVIYWLTSIRLNSFNEGVAVGRAESSLKCAQTLLNNQGSTYPSATPTPTPDTKSQKQSL